MNVICFWFYNSHYRKEIMVIKFIVSQKVLSNSWLKERIRNNSGFKNLSLQWIHCSSWRLPVSSSIKYSQEPLSLGVSFSKSNKLLFLPFLSSPPLPSPFLFFTCSSSFFPFLMRDARSFEEKINKAQTHLARRKGWMEAIHAWFPCARHQYLLLHCPA